MEVDTTAKKLEAKFEFVPSVLPKPLPAKTRSPKRQIVIALSLVVSVIASGVGLMLAQRAPIAPMKSKIPVVTVTAQKAALRHMLRSIKVNGTIWPWDPLIIGSQVNGLTIQTILVD